MVMQGYLRAKGFRFQRQKLRDSIHLVDPDGVVNRGRDKQNILSYDDDQQLQQYIDAHCEFRSDSGYSSATTSITSSNKKSFVQLITKQQLLYKCKAAQ